MRAFKVSADSAIADEIDAVDNLAPLLWTIVRA
jgi:hypothetical protein